MRRASLALALLTLALAPACRSSSPAPAPAPIPPPAQQGNPSTAWWNGAVFYEVFVRSFQDSNGDGTGDLAGLIQRLDYLNDGNSSSATSLGVDAIWLMPIYPSPSTHGYDVVDYQGVNPDYGDLTLFDTLVAEAHRRGMKVILDFVPNHSSSQHPWFQDSSSSVSSVHRDWYVWSGNNPDWRQPWTPCGGAGGATWHSQAGFYYYGLFSTGMPDLNWRAPAVRQAVQAAAAFWLARGVDGFRLDAVRYLVESGPCAGQQDQPETHLYLKEFAAAVRALKPDGALVGEAWDTTATIASYYGSTVAVPGGDELPLLFDFPLAAAILQAVGAGNPGPIASALAEEQRLYPRGAASAPFLTNHDMVRVGSQLGAAQLRTAAAILLTLPGSPFLYYGEELGMQNGTACSGDECKRTPMAWDGTAAGGFTTGTPWKALAPGSGTANVAAETGDPTSLHWRYRTLLRARKSTPALQGGEATLLVTGPGPVLAYLRTGGGETVLVVHNLGAAAVPAVSITATGTAADPLFVDAGVALSGPSSGTWTLAVPAGGSAAWRLH